MATKAQIKSAQDACSHFWGYCSGSEAEVEELKSKLDGAKLGSEDLEDLREWLPVTSGTVGESIRKIERILDRRLSAAEHS
jgi:hypothetical protein